MSSTPALAQVVPVLSDNSKSHVHNGDRYLNARNWKSAIKEYSAFLDEEKKKKEKTGKSKLVSPRTKPENLHTSPSIQITKFRSCLNSPYNQGIVQSTFAVLPKPVMESLYDHGVKVVVAPTIPDYYLSLTRGALQEEVSHPSKGKSLDNVCGQYIRKSKIVVIAENGLDANDAKKDKISLVLHELGHAYDDSIGNVSETSTFKLFYAQDMDAIPVSERSKYEFYQEENRRGCGQVFADIFASRCIDPLCLDPKSKDLAQKFPRTYKYMQEILPARQSTKFSQ